MSFGLQPMRTPNMSYVDGLNKAEHQEEQKQTEVTREGRGTSLHAKEMKGKIQMVHFEQVSDRNPDLVKLKLPYSHTSAKRLKSVKEDSCIEAATIKPTIKTPERLAKVEIYTLDRMKQQVDLQWINGSLLSLASVSKFILCGKAIFSKRFHYLNQSSDHLLPIVGAILITLACISMLACNSLPTQQKIIHNDRLSNRSNIRYCKLDLKYEFHHFGGS